MPYLAGLFILIALFVLIIVIGKISVFKNHDRKLWLQHLQALKKQSAATTNLSELKEILIKSDSLLDTILKKLFPYEDTTPKRYKRLEIAFSLPRDDTNYLWSVHKMRNEIVHTIDYVAKDDEVKKGIQFFEKIILKVIGS